MTLHLAPELAQLAADTEILSRTRFRLGKNERGIDGPGPLFTPASYPATVNSGPEGSAALRQALAAELYGRWYLRCDAVEAPAPDLVAYRDHLVALSRANSCSGCWEPGWRLVDRPEGVRWNEGDVAVEGYGVRFRVSGAEVRPEGGSITVGASCRVRVPGEMRTLRPGFYSALGNADPSDPADLAWVVRLYWHLRAPGAPVLVQALTTGLNERRIPFRLKVVADPRFYIRADAGVLVLEPQHFDAARPVIQRVHLEVLSYLRPEVPSLTLRLAPGLGLAEGSPDASSFGSRLCELIAEAIVSAGRGADGPVRSEAVMRSLRGADLDPAHPFRAPGSLCEYDSLFPNEALAMPRPNRIGETSTSSLPAIPDQTPPDGLLAAACQIGDVLCRQAFRADDRCNWLGRAFAPDPQGGEGLTPALGALGPTLYGGTSGIALFLAELFSRTAEPTHRETAQAAIRQALTAIEREPGRIRPVAFYEGALGVGWAARRVATLIGSAELDARASALLLSIVARLPGDRRMDLLEGNAGAICCLIGLHEETGDTRFLQAAGTLGQELLAATLDTLGPTAGRQAPLTGLAHGAAGIGLALLELWAATGDAAFQIAANRYFTYEDGCFEPGQENWPDFRGVPVDQAGRPVRNPGCMTAWCHGAPGIVLSRLRALESDPMRAARYEPAARAGLRTTVRAIESVLAETDADPCLCHGLAGLAEVARTGARVLDDPKVEKAAKSAIERLALLFEQKLIGNLDPVRPYDPSLLTGEAGVGYTLLRCGEPERVATVLLPRSLEAAAREQQHGRPEGFEHRGRESVEYRLESKTA